MRRARRSATDRRSLFGDLLLTIRLIDYYGQSVTKRRTVPFSGVESLMRGLDEPDRPQTIELEVALVEQLDDQRVRQAVTSAANRHPFARARQRPAKPLDLDYLWEIDDVLRADPVEVRSCDANQDVDAARDAFFSSHIALDAAPPFRVLLIHEEDGDRVLLSANHTAFDGIGAIRLMQSISRAYAGQDDPLPAVDPIEARKTPQHHDRRRSATTLPAFKLPERPARLASAKSVPTAGFGILHLDMDPTRITTPTNATINDVLVAALHSTVASWNRSRNKPCHSVTTMMPVNQRPNAWRSEVVANMVLPGQIRSTPSERARPGSLMAAVTRQTTEIKTNGVTGAADVSRGLRLPVAVRQLLPQLVDAVADLTADTAVLTNLGRIEDPPWFGVAGRGLWFGAPPRAPLNLTVGAATAGGRLSVSFRWCKPAFSAAEARQFADQFLTELDAVQMPGSA